jgi:hypothetical protein
MKIDKKRFVELANKGWNVDELAKEFNVKPNRIYNLARELDLNVKTDPIVREQMKLDYWFGRLKAISNGVDLCGRITIPNDIMQKILHSIEKTKGKL